LALASEVIDFAQLHATPGEVPTASEVPATGACSQEAKRRRVKIVDAAAAKAETVQMSDLLRLLWQSAPCIATFVVL
jgi:hypothetical protein